MPEELIFLNSLPTEEFTDVAECRTQIWFLQVATDCLWFDQCHPVTALINGKDSFNIKSSLYNIKDWKLAWLRQRCFEPHLLCALVSPFQNEKMTTSLIRVLERQLTKCVQSIVISVMTPKIQKESIHLISRIGFKQQATSKAGGLHLSYRSYIQYCTVSPPVSISGNKWSNAHRAKKPE